MRRAKASVLKRSHTSVSTRSLTEEQKTSLQFLLEKGVSKRVALAAATKPQTTLDMIKQKIAVFERTELDSSLCGVSRMPIKYYEHALIESLTKCRVWHVGAATNRLKGDYAKKQLDVAFPEWRERHSIRRVAPSLLYQRVLVLREKGLPLTSHNLITYPVPKGHLKPAHKSEDLQNQAEARVERMRNAGIPLTDLPRKLSIPDVEFEEFIRRQENGRRNTNQQAVHDYLSKLRVREDLVEELSSRQGLSLKVIKRKIEFVRSQKLDPEVYGFKTIPKRYWQDYLGLTFQKFKEKMTTAKKQLADKRAAKLLDQEFPGLRKKPKLRNRSPQTILTRARMLKELGRSVSAYAVRETTTEILMQLIAQKRGLVKPEKRTRRSQAKETALDFVKRNKIHASLFNQMLFRLQALHRMRQKNKATAGKLIADPAIIVGVIRSKKTIRNRVSERNMNLFANWVLGQNPMQIQPLKVERPVENVAKTTKKPVQGKTAGGKPVRQTTKKTVQKPVQPVKKQSSIDRLAIEVAKKVSRPNFAEPTRRGSIVAEREAKKISAEIARLERTTSVAQAQVRKEEISKLKGKRQVLVDYMYGRLPKNHKVVKYLNSV